MPVTLRQGDGRVLRTLIGVMNYRERLASKDAHIERADHELFIKEVYQKSSPIWVMRVHRFLGFVCINDGLALVLCPAGEQID